MSYMIAVPDMLSSAAGDLASIGSSIHPTVAPPIGEPERIGRRTHRRGKCLVVHVEHDRPVVTEASRGYLRMPGL